jgi:hypothetical protein
MELAILLLISAIVIFPLVLWVRHERRVAARRTAARDAAMARELQELRGVLHDAGVPERELPSADPAQLHVVRMQVQGLLHSIRLDDGDAPVRTEPLPSAPHGEMPRGIWGAGADLYVAGYQYTGDDGEDTGTIYHRLPDGSWRVEWQTEARLFGSIWGSGLDNIYAVGGSCARFDGRAWREETIEGLGGGYLLAVWGSSPLDVYVSTGDGRIFRSRGDGRWQLEASLGCALHTLGGWGDQAVWAAGNEGRVFRRRAAGEWVPEESGTRAQLVSFFAASPEEAYLAGGEHLLRSRGDGSWQPVDGAPAWTRRVTGTPEGEIFVGGPLARLQAGRWEPIPLEGSIDGLWCDGRVLHVLGDRTTQLD